MSEPERVARRAQIARRWVEREGENRLTAVRTAMKRAKVRCLVAAREHFSRAERTGEAQTDPLCPADSASLPDAPAVPTRESAED